VDWLGTGSDPSPASRRCGAVPRFARRGDHRGGTRSRKALKQIGAALRPLLGLHFPEPVRLERTA